MELSDQVVIVSKFRSSGVGQSRPLMILIQPRQAAIYKTSVISPLHGSNDVLSNSLQVADGLGTIDDSRTAHPGPAEHFPGAPVPSCQRCPIGVVGQSEVAANQQSIFGRFQDVDRAVRAHQRRPVMAIPGRQATGWNSAD